ncbi:MAG: protein kinase [Planctomycetota bacterium]|nr:protein kinase [Planctomycetota bacterium]
MAGRPYDSSEETERSRSGRRRDEPKGWPYVRAGDRLGRYRIREFLGRGGMGRVYRADGPDGPVALKLIHPQFLRQEDFLRRFMLEAGAGKRVKHPNVVRTYGCEVVRIGNDDQAMLVMEHVEGRTLMQLSKDLDRVPDGFLRDIAQGITRGLEAIHAAGVIHRDLKPENVMITTENQIKIMDLGVARLRTDEIRLSRTGHFVGSLLFAAPEQLSDNGVRCGPAADLYAVGLLLFVLATGDHPFPAGTAGEIINAHLNNTPKRVREVVPEISPFIESVTDTLLAKAPADRFPSATALRETLETAESSEWWLDRRHLRPEDGSGSTQLPVRRLGPVRGRPTELRELNASWRRAMGGSGGVILITGETGIGKSRLVDAFLEGLRLPSGSVGLAVPDADADADGEPGSAFRRALATLVQDDPEQLESLLPSAPGTAERMRAFLADGAPADAGDALRCDVLETVRALTTHCPRVIAFDDLDRHTPLDQTLFRALALQADRLPLLLVGMARPCLPADLVDELARLPRVRRLPLVRLDGSNAERVLGDILESTTLAGRLAPELLPITGGNPLFLTEFVEGMKATNVLTRDPGGQWRCAEHVAEAAVPDTLHVLFDQRLSSLDEEARAVVEAAAVQGEMFDIGLVAKVLDQPVLHVLDCLHGLGNNPQIVRGGGETRRFDPALGRAIVLERLGPEGARRLHARTAEVLAAPEDGAPLESSRIALHYLRASMAAEAEPYVLDAVSTLATAYRYSEALTLAAEVVAHRDSLPPPLVLRVLVERARSLELLGRRDEEREALSELEAFAEAHGMDVPHEAVDARGRLLLVDGELEAARAVFESQLDDARDAGARLREARARGNLGCIAMRTGEIEDARSHFERSLLLARAARDLGAEITCHENLGDLFESEGQGDRARMHVGRRLELAARLSDLRDAARAHGALARLSRRWGRFRESQVHVDRQLALARQVGDRGAECHALRGLGALHAARGRLESALEALTGAERVATDAGRELDVAAIWTDLARLHLLRGEETSMVHLAMRALSKAQRLRVPGLLVAALTLAGNAAEEGDQLDEALDWYHQALDGRRRRHRAGGEIAPLFGLARIWRLRGRADHAAAPLDQIVHLAGAYDLYGPRLVAESMRAAALESPPHRVLALLVRDVDRLTVHERFCVHLEMATATGDPLHLEEARAILDALAADCGQEAVDLAAGYSLYRRIPGYGSARQLQRRAS